MPARSNKKGKKGDEAELRGPVVLQKVSEGSKSEHDAVCLLSEEGTFVLRRVGGNPFQDDTLLSLVGKKITSHGRINGQYFFITDYKEEK